MTQLERECRVFARYLSGQEPTSYVIEKYVKLNQQREPSLRVDEFDAELLAGAVRGQIWLRFFDSYARIFRKDSVLRKKLIMVLALLECTPPTFEKLDTVPSGGFLGAGVRMAGISIRFVFAALAGFLIITPTRMRLGARER